MEKIKHPILGIGTSEDDFFTFSNCVQLWNKDVILEFIKLGEEVLPEQVETYEWLVREQRNIKVIVEEKCYEYGKELEEEEELEISSDNVEAIIVLEEERPEDIGKFLKLESVGFSAETKDESKGCFTLYIEPGWDKEHLIGIQFINFKFDSIQ
ncbi:MAG: hypothetical protein HRT89_13595 [Lentisphaeria bacterium]|nr:hypothetical protein [Lentisphaeria bacterium]NQZ69092.1 hypothetical protein [Lentisphaeria bacterium]